MSNEELNKIADLVAEKTLFATKEVLNSEETAKYLGISKGYLYILTARRAIPHYKPLGKKCYFNRQEIEAWLQSNRVATTAEINEQAADYCNRKGGAV